MFGIFKKKTMAPFKADDRQRPLRPAIQGLFTPEAADATQKQLALSWAHQWLCLGEQTSPANLLPDLDAAISGKLKLRDTPDHAVLRTAVRALQSAAAENRANRTAGAFPWRELRLGPQLDCCQSASDIAGKLIPTNQFLSIPLPGCDAGECKCWFRQVTKAEHQRRTSEDYP